MCKGKHAQRRGTEDSQARTNHLDGTSGSERNQHSTGTLDVRVGRPKIRATNGHNTYPKRAGHVKLAKGARGANRHRTRMITRRQGKLESKWSPRLQQVSDTCRPCRISKGSIPRGAGPTPVKLRLRFAPGRPRPISKGGPESTRRRSKW